MNDVTLAVELEGGESQRLQPGDVVRGHVKVSASDVIACKPLHVALRYGHAESSPMREAASVEVLRGELTPGEHRLPFAVTIPADAHVSGPGRGTYMWCVEASIKRSWAEDPQVRQRITVGERISGELLRVDNEVGIRPALYGAIGLLMVVGGGYWAWLEQAAGGSERIVVAGALVLGGLYAIGWSLRATISRLSWGRVVVELSPGAMKAGGSAECVVTVTPGRTIQLTRGIIRLAGGLYVTLGDTTKESVDHQQVELVGQGHQLVRGQESRLSAQLRVPSDASATFYTEDRCMVWTVNVKLDAAGMPRCELEVPVQVVR